MITDELGVIAHNITWLRKKHGLSKKEMVRLLGVGTASISTMEKGMFPPRTGINALFLTSKHFHIPVCKLCSKLLQSQM